MRTEQVQIFTFDELSETAKEKARQWFRDASSADEWWDGTFDDVKNVAKLMGVEIERIGFSGFSSQGDGAHFVGSFAYRPGCVKAVTAYAPLDTRLQAIANQWQALQKHHFYKLSGTVKHSGHYQHENCTDFDVYRDGEWVNNSETEEAVKEVMRDFMRWIYRALEKDWDAVNSDENVDANIVANEYEFTVTGERF